MTATPCTHEILPLTAPLATRCESCDHMAPYGHTRPMATNVFTSLTPGRMATAVLTDYDGGRYAMHGFAGERVLLELPDGVVLECAPEALSWGITSDWFLYEGRDTMTGMLVTGRAVIARSQSHARQMGSDDMPTTISRPRSQASLRDSLARWEGIAKRNGTEYARQTVESLQTRVDTYL